jgi:hypothetical protein
MASVTKRDFSASTDGGPVLVAATSTAGTTIHAGVTGTVDWDEVWIWLVNNHSADVEVEIEWENATASQNIVQTIPFDSGLVQVVPGFILQNDKTVAIFASITNVVAAYGYVNRITA